MGVFKRGKVYYICYSHNGKQHKEAVGENKRMAEQALIVRKAEIAQGKFNLAPKKQRIRFADFAGDFIKWANENKKPRAAERYKTSLVHLNDYFGSRTLADIHPFHIEGFKSKRIQSVVESTVNRDLACLSKLFNLAIKWGRAEKNPMTKVDMFPEPEGRVRYLSEDEIHLLHCKCETEREKIFVTLGIATGMRYKELLSLKWSNINFRDSLIVFEETKNNKVGEIPMTTDVIELLSQVEQKGEYVICKADGSGYMNFRKTWNNLRKRCGFGTDVTPHVLRHTFATILVRNKVDLPTVMELGRWSSLKMVLRYAHVSQDHRTRSINSLNGIFYPKSIPNEKRPPFGVAVNQ